MRIGNNFSVFTMGKYSSNKNEKYTKNNPSFGATTDEAKKMIDLLGIRKFLGGKLLCFIDNQESIVLDFTKPDSKPYSFSLNWAEEKYVPRRRKISKNVFDNGGLKFEPSGEASLESFKDFLKVSKVMVVYSLQSTVEALEKYGKSNRQKALCKDLKETLPKIINHDLGGTDLSPEDEYKLIRNHFTEMANAIK